MNIVPPARARRKPSLTPMIDVVFLLLVFFMLASRFGLDQVIQMPLAGGDNNTPYSGPPRLVDITDNGVALNGVELAADTQLADALRPLTQNPSDTIILRARNGATVQRVLDISDGLRRAGFTTLVLVD